MRQVTLGAIGAGRIGKLHTENILRMPGVRMKLIADPYMDENWAREHGLTATTEPEAVFADEDIEDLVIAFSAYKQAIHDMHKDVWTVKGNE